MCESSPLLWISFAIWINSRKTKGLYIFVHRMSSIEHVFINISVIHPLMSLYNRHFIFTYLLGNLSVRSDKCSHRKVRNIHDRILFYDNYNTEEIYPKRYFWALFFTYKQDICCAHHNTVILKMTCLSYSFPLHEP